MNSVEKKIPNQGKRRRVVNIWENTPSTLKILSSDTSIRSVRIEGISGSIHTRSLAERTESPEREQRVKMWTDEFDLSLLPKNIEELSIVGFSQIGFGFDLTSLSGHRNLQHIELDCKDFIDLRPLEALPLLTHLRVSGVVGIHLLSSPTLKTLDLSNGRLIYPYVMPDVFRRYYERIKAKDVINLRHLDGCTNLESIDLRRNVLGAIDLSPFLDIQVGKNGSLPKIDLRNNQHLVAVYLPNGVIPNGGSTDSFIKVDSNVLIFSDYGRYKMLIAEEL